MARDFEKLLCWERLGGRLGERDTIERDQYSADYDKLVFSRAIRSLMGKTQVYDALEESGRSRNRLTHSLEAASIARSLGVAVGARMVAWMGWQGAPEHAGFWRIDPNQIGSICAAGALMHDIGLPPLGHVGEEVIGAFFATNDLRHLISNEDGTDYEDLIAYEGNAINLRLVAKVDGWRGERGGLNLTAATLATMKYPFSRRAPGKKKYGVLAEDVQILDWIAVRTGMQPDGEGAYRRHPLAWIVEAADDMAWCVADVEDAANLGTLEFEHAEDLLGQLLLKQDLDEAAGLPSGPRRLAFMRSRAIRRMVDAVVDLYPSVAEGMENGTLDPSAQDLLDRSGYGRSIRSIKAISRERIYKSDRVMEVRARRSASMERALERIMSAVEAVRSGDREGRETAFLDNLAGWRLGSSKGCQVRRALDAVTMLGDKDIVDLGA